MNGFAEQLAGMSWKTVVVIIFVLIGLRYVLIKQGSDAAKSIAEFAESLAIALGLVFLVIKPFFVQAFFIPSQSMYPTLIGNKRIRDHILVNKAVYVVGDPKKGDIVVFKAPPEATSNATSLEGGKNTQMDFIKRCIAVPGDDIYVTPGYLVVDNIKKSRHDIFPYSDTRTRILDDGLLVDGKKVSKAELAIQLRSSNIQFHPGRVYVNGKAISDPYVAEDPDSSYPIPESESSYVKSMEDSVTLAERLHKLELVRDKSGHIAAKLGPNEYFMMGDNRNDSWDSRYWGPVDRKSVIGKAMFIFWPLSRVQWVR